MRRLILASVPITAVVVLAGCAGSADAGAGTGADDGLVHVVASTNVYGDLASAVGGERVEVESIITSLAQDPHSYEASARDQLTISRADLVIHNGGGYDAFIDQLVESSETDAVVLTAAEFSHDWPENNGHDHSDEEHDHDHDHGGHDDDGHDHGGHDHGGHDHIEGFNEHVWYDPHTMIHLVEDIAAHLGELDPDGAAEYERNAEVLIAELETLEAQLDELSTASAGDEVFVTEPVPLYLVEAAGLVNVTPGAFSEAVEAGQDVPASTMLEAIRVLEGGDVRALIANAQTGGAETTEAIRTAEGAGIPVLEFTELVPQGETYVTWMRGNIDAIADTLTR